MTDHSNNNSEYVKNSGRDVDATYLEKLLFDDDFVRTVLPDAAVSEIRGAKRAKEIAEELAEANQKSANGIEIKEVTPPGSDHPVKVYTDGNAQINRGKVDTYIRGKVELDVEATKARIAELEALDTNYPDLFDAAAKTELRKLEDSLHNYQRSQEMSVTLNNAGIIDTPAYNQMITENLLEAAKQVTPGNTEIISCVSGPYGEVQMVSGWNILEDGTPYLATIILKPVK